MIRKIFKGILGLLLLVGLLFVAGVLWPVPVPEPNPRAERLLITNVSVIDVETGAITEGQSILIENGIITDIGNNMPAADNVEIYDAGGRYVIPGLFDMHVHSIKLSPAITHPLFVAAGVTAVRDMGGCMGEDDPWVACADEKRAWNVAAGSGTMIGPRFDHITGLALNGGRAMPGGLDPDLGGKTPEGAEARVILDKARNLDFLKPYTMIPKDGYFALAEAAAQNNMYLAGHLPLAVSGLEAVNAGQRSIEHAFLFIWECYPGMAGLRQSDNPRAVYTKELRLGMIEEHDAALCSALHQAMVANGTAYVPTHTTRKLDAYATNDAYRNDARLKYIPGPLRAIWLQDADGMAARAGEDGQDSYRAFYEFGLEQTGAAHRAGVMILAGTDTPDSFAFPGSGLHDELGHYVEAGLTPLEALQTATLYPARFLGLEGKAGVIKAGARADLVFLDENPLDDIGALDTIDAVILAGTVYNSEDLDQMLIDVEAAAGHWSMWPKFTWQILMSPIMRKQFGD